MPVRATKRGADRTPLDADVDVLICGASFAGLAVARELAGSGARVMMIDRYEVGERQTSACAAPTEWLENLGVAGTIRQTFGELLFHTAHADVRYRMPWTYSTFDYRQLCAALQAQGDARFETAKVEGITRGRTHVVHTDRGDVRAPLVVDALGWRRILGSDMGITPPNARMSRGLEVHPSGTGEDLELWLDPRYLRAGYSWSFPAGDELRVGCGSFDPHDHVKQPTLKLAEDTGVPAVRYQGNWIPHQLRPATDDGVFFAGDSAGHCFPLTAEGIRPALYFGLACGRELRAVVEGRQTREQALERYASRSDDATIPFRWLLNAQHVCGRITPTRLITWVIKAMSHQRFVDHFFRKYLDVTPPGFVLAGPRARLDEPAAASAAAAAPAAQRAAA